LSRLPTEKKNKERKMATQLLENQLEFPFMQEARKEEEQRNFEARLFIYGTTTSMIFGIATCAILDYLHAPQVYDIVQKFIGN
jgi:hypothetical protein